MSFAFYTALYVSEGKQHEKQVLAGGNDDTFTRFLQADKARVLLPFKPANNLKGLYYLSSGLIWTGVEALTPAIETVVDIIFELKVTEQPDPIEHPAIEGQPWEITIPTAMQVLQKQDYLPNIRQLTK